MTSVHHRPWLAIGMLMAAGCGAPGSSGPTDATRQDTAASSSQGAVGPAGDDGAALSDGATGDRPAATTQPGVAKNEEPGAPAFVPVLAATSYPPGVAPLNDAETAQLKNDCGGLVSHLRKLAAKDGSSRERLEHINDVLKEPPAIPGVDVVLCAKLMRRSVRAFRAQTIESDGINGIKRIVVGLALAMSSAKAELCPSAAAVPVDHQPLKNGPVRVPAAAWATPGWQCVNFDLRGAPQSFQYSLQTDPKAQSYEIVARGYPVDGEAAVELFLKGGVRDQAIQPSSEIYRRPSALP